MDETVADGFISSIFITWNNCVKIGRHVGLSDLCDETSIRVEKVEKLMEIASRLLVYQKWSPKEIGKCTIVCQFFVSVLSQIANNSCESSNALPFQRLVLNKLFPHIHESLELFSHSLNDDNPKIPRVAYAFGLLRQLLDSPTTTPIISLILSHLHRHWQTFGTLLESICRRENGVPTDEQVVLTYEVLRLWKLALKCQIQVYAEDQGEFDLIPFSSLASALHNVLVDATQEQALFEERSDPDCIRYDNRAPSLWFDSSMVHLLIRSLRSLHNMVHHTDLLHSLQSTVDRIWIRLVCPLFDSALPVETVAQTATPCSLVITLAQSEATLNSNQKLQQTLLRPDFGVCLRLIITSILELACRCDFSDTVVLTLYRSLRVLTLATQNPHSKQSTYEDLFVTLMSGDDEHLFRALYLWLLAEQRLSRQIPVREQWLNVIPDAHWLFASLAHTVDYSAHALLDWIVSPETDCLTYLVHYLRRFRVVQHDFQPPVRDSTDGLALGTLSATANSSVWPTDLIRHMFQQLSSCLQALHRCGNIPFNPSPLIRRLDCAVDVLENA